MPLTREFRETLRARLLVDPSFRRELLHEAVECLTAGDADTAKAILRNYINAGAGTEVRDQKDV